MKKLLERLAELEPDRLHISDHLNLRLFPYPIELNNGEPTREWHLGVIQDALQEAIFGHGWNFSLENARKKSNDPLTHVCRVFTCSWDGLYSGQTTQGPAHAMLEAYVKALEAVKEPEAEEVVV